MNKLKFIFPFIFLVACRTSFYSGTGNDMGCMCKEKSWTSNNHSTTYWEFSKIKCCDSTGILLHKEKTFEQIACFGGKTVFHREFLYETYTEKNKTKKRLVYKKTRFKKVICDYDSLTNKLQSKTLNKFNKNIEIKYGYNGHKISRQVVKLGTPKRVQF